MNTVMETVGAVCNQVRSKSKHGASFQNLLVLVRREFRIANFNLKIKSTRDKTLGSEEFYVNAYYDAEDDKNKETPIEVVVHHNFDNTVLWDPLHTTDFLIQIFDATVHEFKHQRQSVKRKYRVYSNSIKQPYKDYLEEDDEIDAYAFSIAVELCRTLGKYRALRYMHKMSALAKLKFNGKYVSPCLSSYFGQFGDLTNPIIRRIAKKVYVRLQKIDTDAVFM
jgi:hypothetical protein